MSARSAESRPSASERVSAVIAIGSLAAALIALAVNAALRIGEVTLALIGMVGCVTAGWYVVSRRGLVRMLGVISAVACLAALVVGIVLAVMSLWMLAAVVALGVISVLCARHALRRTPKALRSHDQARERRAVAKLGGVPARPAASVLIINPRSGGGKAERLQLADACVARGIEPIVLRPGDDLISLAEKAVAAGAQVIGMAGGDGSQAQVASVAARHRVPHVCVPAGTRNHFALDLGLDRADVIGALDAYTDRVERRVDLAWINGRPFVNNCSLGLYAKVVHSPQYREAKLRTAAQVLPDLIGPDSAPFDLRFFGPDGTRFSTAHLLLISNNPYQLVHLSGRGTRERLDTGLLGIVVAQVSDAAGARRFMLLEVAGQVRRFAGWREWTAARFELDSAGPVEVGIDGEALVLDPPLAFECQRGALRVWLPKSALRASPAARAVWLLTRSTAADLASVAAGGAPGRIA